MSAGERELAAGGSIRRDSTGSSALLRALLVALTAAAILFGGFELLERSWLSDVDAHTLGWLHRIRGAAAALAAASVAGWFMLRSGTSLRVPGPLPGAPADDSRMDPRRNRLHCAHWFILMRWIAVAVGAAAVYIAVDVAEVLPHAVAPRLGALIVLLMLVNVGYAVYLTRREASTTFLIVQVYADIVFLMLLLHFSGGIENPLTPMLLLHVIIAGIVLGRLHSYLVAAVASVLFGILAWGECTGVLPHYTLTIFPHNHLGGLAIHAAQDPLYAGSLVALQSVILFLVASFTTTLVERIHRDERQLEALADRALAQAQTLERALDTTGTALCLCDRELRPFWANRRWTEWQAQVPELRCSIGALDSLAGSTLRDGEIRQNEIRSASNSSDSAAGEVHSDGRVFHVTSAPLRDRDGGIGHVVTLARDVTDQYEAQAHAMRAERLAAVGELAGQVAHEVNNPIAIISAKARLLLRARPDELPERASQEITKIAELSDRVARIAQGLLSYCRPAPGVRAPLDVRVPLRRALAYVETRAAGAGVRLHDDLGGPLPFVRANGAELEQVFLNLFLNSLDAMPAGGDLRVSARTAEPAVPGGCAMLVVDVADTGAGIREEIRHRVFEPFMTTKGEKGSGLGLSICQGLVRSHGGAIELASEAERGTRVTVTLPVVAQETTLDLAGAHG